MRRRKSQDIVIADALDRHADALFAGGTGRRVRRQFESDSSVDILFSLAEELTDILTPVEPSARFVRQLKAHRAEAQADRLAVRGRRTGLRRNVLGTLISIFAISALAARIAASLVMLIALLINLNKRRRSAAAL
jgi:hypothetical protein